MVSAGQVAVWLLVGACAFLVGFAANQGGTCAVSAMRDIVWKRRFDRMVGFALAAAAAGLVLLPLAWATGRGAEVAREAQIGGLLAAGGVLLGAGAVLNGACLMGSLWRLGSGELRLLALPIGLGLGFLAAASLPDSFRPVVGPGRFADASAWGFMLVAASLPVIGLAVWWLSQRGPAVERGRWPLGVAMALLGIAGAVLYVLQPGWTYADAVRRGVSPLGMMMSQGGIALAIVALTVTGAVTSAVASGKFAPRRPSGVALARSLGGGFLMAIGASAIPGGNDTLLLAAVPAGSVSGLAAYGLMNLTVLTLVWARASARRA